MTKRTDSAQPPNLSNEIDKAGLVSDLSHELRTVLGGIIGINELLLTSELSPHQRHLSETIDQSSQTLLSVLNDVVDFSRIELGKVKLEEAPCDLRQIIDESVALVQKSHGGKTVDLQITCEGLPTAAVADTARLRQIIRTLLARLSFTVPEGGVHLHATTEQTEGSTTLHISVTGGPIADFSESFLATLSQPNKPERKFESRWLSLYLCAQIVELMNGTCGCDITGKTCKLWVALPLRASGI